MARKDALLGLHDRLVAKRNALRAKLIEENKLSRGAAGGHGDVGDAASAAEQGEIDSQLAALESRELHQVSRAIDLIRQGRYGKCEVCRKSIPVARLNALPFAPYCVECQRDLEASGGSMDDHAADWASAYEFEGRMSDHELTLGDIDID